MSPPSLDHRAPAAGLVLFLLLVSGAVALVYQSLWTRQLSLILGSTTYAVGTVLAAFMAGLGVGAFVLGRRADRVPRPLRLYALLEGAIGLAGLASPVLLAQGNGLYALCYARLHGHPALLTLARFLIGFLLVAVPAFLMGGTLPVATRHLVRHAGGLGRRLGLLYALNTLGAALGVLALPFLLLPVLGMRATLLACGATNIAIGVAAWLAAGRGAPVPGVVTSQNAPPTRRVTSGLLAGFFVSGFVALALEAVWNRFFVMFFGSSVYSYAVILALYLGGVVAGGLLFTRAERRGLDPRRVFVVCLLLLIADLAVTVPLMDRVLYLQLAVLDRLGLGFGTFHLANVAAAVLVILPPTMLFGISFPAVATAASRGVERLGSELGFVYLVNTAGTTAGALAASFVLIPGLGVRRTLDLLALVTVAAVACVAGRGWWTTTRGRLAALAVVGAACLPAVLPAWDYRFMSTPINKEPGTVLQLWRSGQLAAAVDAISVLEVRDGVDATVSVADYGGGSLRALLVNGKVDASNKDAFTQAMVGHLPMLLRPAAQDVLIVGFGSGMTLAAAAAHPAATFDLVEISPEVLDLGDRYFRAVNRDVMHDPRVTVYVEDGRNFIAFSRDRTYDVIISQPSNPWMTGVANLFTDDFFAAVRRRLRPGGLLSQWFQYYSMSPEDVRILIGTLRRRFPEVYVFTFYERVRGIGDLVLLASDAPIDFGPALAAFRGEGAAGTVIHQIGLTAPEDLAAALVASPETLDRLVAGADLNSDDRPRIELHAPRALFGGDQIAVLRNLLEGSGGARLREAPPADASVEPVPGSGLHPVAGGYQTAALPAGATFITRDVRRALTFAADGDASRRLEVLSAQGARDRAGLGRLAAEAAGGPVEVVGEVPVQDHTAITYRASATGRTVVAWSCPETRTALAVVDQVGGAPPLPVRCRHGG